jgi:alcohol dehydrogenase class IV
MVREATARARAAACKLVVAFGGGSAIDAAKAVSALLANGGDPLDYMEVVGQGKILAQPALPCVAIPTTAGTGAEVTRNAVVSSPEHRVKASLRSPTMLPRVALVDPLLTHTLPPAITASTGLDAFTQLLEPFVSARANPLTDGFCREGLARVARSLERAYWAGDDATARADMALASLLGGLALANAGLGAAHGIASVVGGMFTAPHGAVCARLLPFVMEANVRALQARQPENPALARYGEAARIVTGDQGATVLHGVAWVQELCARLQVHPLSAYGMQADDLPVVVEKSAVASSTKANPLPLTLDELATIVQQAM